MVKLTASTSTENSDDAEGLSEPVYLLVIGAVGVVGWGGTAAVAARPGAVSGVVSPAVAVMTLWLALLVALFGIGYRFTVREIRTDRMLTVWAVASVGAVAVNIVAIAGPAGWWQAYGIIHPWLLVYSLGFLAQAADVTPVRQFPYAVGGLLGAAVLVAAAFEPFGPATLFALTGTVHVLPVALDIAVLKRHAENPSIPA